MTPKNTPPQSSHSDLMAQIRAGNDSAVTELYSRMSPRINDIIRRVRQGFLPQVNFYPSTDLDQIKNDSFLAVVETIRKDVNFAPNEGDLYAMVWASSRNDIIDSVRRTGEEEVVEGSMKRPRTYLFDEIGVNEEEDIIDDRESAGYSESLIELMERIPNSGYRDAVKLTYLENMTQDEIAERMGVDQRTVRRYLRAGERSLRSIATRAGYDLPAEMAEGNDITPE